MRPRTKRQREILDFITGFVDNHGHDPSYSQIALNCGVNSKGGIAKHIEALELQGLLSRTRVNGKFRLEVRTSEAVEEITCRIDWLSLPESMADCIPDYELIIPRFMAGVVSPNKLRGFVVQNDAMIDQHIREGDIAIIEKRSLARDRDCVVAEIPDGEVVLSGYRRSGGNINLVPANERYDTLVFPADEIKVLGIYRGLLRPAI